MSFVTSFTTQGLNADSYDGGRDHGIWMPLKVANPSMVGMMSNCIWSILVVFDIIPLLFAFVSTMLN